MKAQRGNAEAIVRQARIDAYDAVIACSASAAGVATKAFGNRSARELRMAKRLIERFAGRAAAQAARSAERAAREVISALPAREREGLRRISPEMGRLYQLMQSPPSPAPRSEPLTAHRRLASAVRLWRTRLRQGAHRRAARSAHARQHGSRRRSETARAAAPSNSRDDPPSEPDPPRLPAAPWARRAAPNTQAASSAPCAPRGSFRPRPSLLVGACASGTANGG